MYVLLVCTFRWQYIYIYIELYRHIGWTSDKIFRIVLWESGNPTHIRQRCHVDSLCYTLRNSSISLSSLCRVTRPPCFTPSQNSFARIFLCVSSGINSSRSQIRRFASVGPVPRLIKWSSNVSWTWSRNCCTSSECLRLMSTSTHKHSRNWLE